MPLPSDSSHLSAQPSSEMIDEFWGAVESQFAKSSIMKQYLDVRTIRGTDTAFNRQVGRTQLQGVTPGVRPDATPTQFGRTSVTVDTTVLARANVDLLNDFQTDFAVRAELGKDQGKEHAKFYDRAMLIQGIKAAYRPAPANLGGAIGAGKLEQLPATGDDLDPELLYRAISDNLIKMQEEDIDTSECITFVRPTHYDVLNENDKLANKDFSGSGGMYDKGVVGTIQGTPIVSTARIPNAAITGHLLSNVSNGAMFDLTAAEARAVAVTMHPKSLLVGETIGMHADVYWEKTELQWFIDSYTAFGAAPNRPDVCAVVNRA